MMEETYLLLMEKIVELTEKNGETDAAALAWETGMKHGDILLRLKEMEEKNGWLHMKLICAAARSILWMD